MGLKTNKKQLLFICNRNVTQGPIVSYVESIIITNILYGESDKRR